MNENKPDKQLLFFGLSLLDRNHDEEAAWVKALAGVAHHVTGLVLMLPSVHEAPKALGHPLVHQVAELCRILGVDLYLGRRLWVCWSNYAKRKQCANDVYDPAYYAACLARIHSEAVAVGAQGTLIDVEGYGESIYKPWFRGDGFTDGDRRHVEKTVGKALDVVPPVDLITPAGGGQPTHFSWPMQPLGRAGLCSKTFTVRNLADLILNPPPGYPRKVDYWGALLTPDVTRGPLIEQLYGLDWSAIESAHPECQGMWLMTDPKHRLSVFEGLRRV